MSQRLGPGRIWCACVNKEKGEENLNLLAKLAVDIVPFLPLSISLYTCKDLHGWSVVVYVRDGSQGATRNQEGGSYKACKDENKFYKWAEIMAPIGCRVQGVGERKALPLVTLPGLLHITEEEKAEHLASGNDEDDFTEIAGHTYLKLDEERQYPLIVYWTTCRKCLRKGKQGKGSRDSITRQLGSVKGIRNVRNMNVL